MNSPNPISVNNHSNLILPEHWKITETFEDELTFLGHPVSISGIVAQNSLTQRSIHGSAADESNDRARLRAYFELLERISILDHHSRGVEFTPGMTKPSLSSGVAIHTDLESAKLNAALELLERDAILTHWYEAKSPIEYLDREHKLYEFKTVVPGISTWMTLIENPIQTEGFPALWFGYGTHRDPAIAIHKSKLEALQSACFTHDVELTHDLPATADVGLHQDFHLHPVGNQILKRWLASPRYSESSRKIEMNEMEYDIFEFKIGTEMLYSVRARHPKLRSLVFGVESEFRGELASYQKLLHQYHPPSTDYRSLPHPIP